MSDIAILAAEFFHPDGRAQHPTPTTAPRRCCRSSSSPSTSSIRARRFENYRLIILPDEIPVDAELAASRSSAIIAQGGKLILTGSSGINGRRQLRRRCRHPSQGDTPVAFDPSYVRAAAALDGAMTQTPFVVYGTGQTIAANGAEVLAEIVPPYFNRNYAHFSSHQHTPDDPNGGAARVPLSRQRARSATSRSRSSRSTTRWDSRCTSTWCAA